MNGFTNTSMRKLCMPSAKKAGGDLYKHLRCQKKRRKRYGSNERRGKIPNRVSIEQRPAIVEERKRLGDWEADTVIGKKSPYALVTLVERKSRITLLKKIDQRTAAATKMVIIQMLTSYKTKTLAITCDNDQSTTHTSANCETSHPLQAFSRAETKLTVGDRPNIIKNRNGQLESRFECFYEGKIFPLPGKIGEENNFAFIKI